MRKSIVIICSIILIFCLWLLLHQNGEPVKKDLSEVQSSQTNQPPAQTTQSPSISKPSAALLAETEARPLSTPEGSNAFQQRILDQWQRPIEFYGKVVDENTNPVAGASVTFKWAELPSEEGNKMTNAESDADGLFSLHGQRGPSLEIWVSKEGYYTAHRGQIGVSYLHGDFSPDAQNPIVFLLHKKGKGAELITSENGMRPDVWVRVPKDNTPVKVDFFQKQASATGQLEINQVKPPFQGATNWSLTMTIPDGGLIENQDEFQFTAPESGYQPSVEYDFAKGETNWTTQVTKQFYIAFGQPRKYGWLRIESDLAQETIFVTYAINPSGSQNLEPAQ